MQFFASTVIRLRAWTVGIVLLSQGQAISAGIGLFLGIIATEPGQVAGKHRARPCRIAEDRPPEGQDGGRGSDGYAVFGQAEKRSSKFQPCCGASILARFAFLG